MVVISRCNEKLLRENLHVPSSLINFVVERMKNEE